MGMTHQLTGAVREARQRLDDGGLRIAYELKNRRQVAAQRLHGIAAHLNALNPMAVLGRGYSITRDSDGGIIRAADETGKGRTICTILGKGRLVSSVMEIES
jgi:exodeoxyribonuclease VII large subunit